jgi:NMD protein affecting ribosome stability and mRNA decay
VVVSPEPDPSEYFHDSGLPTPLPKVSHVDALPPAASPGAVWFTVCAWCDRIKLRERWTDSALARQQVELALREDTNVTHGICPACFQAVSRSAEIARERRPRSA